MCVNCKGQTGSYQEKIAVTLNLLWPPVVFVAIEQLDVDKMQMRMARITLSWLFVQSQDCGLHVHTLIIRWSEN